MQRFAILVTVLLAMPVLSFASKLEQELNNKWLGAWVITTVETHSGCDGRHTSNRVNGRLVNSGGRHQFRQGELAKVTRIDAKRSRVDLYLAVAEPVLLSYEDGPFTLYKEAGCKMELEVEVPRDMVKSKDSASLDRILAPIMKRFSDIDEAQATRSWNGRERDSYPEDYEQTLAEHAIWKAEQRNALIQSRIDEALTETTAITSRIGSNPDYLSGFSRGVKSARNTDLGDCSRLLAIDLSKKPSTVSQAKNTSDTMTPRARLGYRDGKNLIYSLEMVRTLPECFVPIPEAPVDP